MSAAVVAADPYRCPNCKSTHIVLEGKYQKRFQREVVDGEDQGEVQEEGYTQRFTAVVCPACNLRIEIEPDHVIALMTENMELRMKLAQQAGQAVAAPGKGPKVN